MPHKAECGNDGCERGQWELTKHPDDYSGGGPSCPECGTTRVRIYMDDKSESRSTGGAETAPARREPERAEARPVVREGAGAGLAEGFLVLTDDDVDPYTRAKAAQQTLGGLGRLASQVMTYNEKKREARENRARDVDLEPVTDKPECGNCGYQFKEVPMSDDSVVCPECGLEHVVVE